MPIKSHIDKDQKMIHTVCTGVITKNDFDYYLYEFLSKSDIAGCYEIFDTREGLSRMDRSLRVRCSGQ